MKNMLGGSHLGVKKGIQGQSCPLHFVFAAEYRVFLCFFVDTKVLDEYIWLYRIILRVSAYMYNIFTWSSYKLVNKPG